MAVLINNIDDYLYAISEYNQIPINFNSEEVIELGEVIFVSTIANPTFKIGVNVAQAIVNHLYRMEKPTEDQLVLSVANNFFDEKVNSSMSHAIRIGGYAPVIENSGIYHIIEISIDNLRKARKNKRIYLYDIVELFYHEYEHYLTFKKFMEEKIIDATAYQMLLDDVVKGAYIDDKRYDRINYEFLYNETNACYQSVRKANQMFLKYKVTGKYLEYKKGEEKYLLGLLRSNRFFPKLRGVNMMSQAYYIISQLLSNGLIHIEEYEPMYQQKLHILFNADGSKKDLPTIMSEFSELLNKLNAQKSEVDQVKEYSNAIMAKKIQIKKDIDNATDLYSEIIWTVLKAELVDGINYKLNITLLKSILDYIENKLIHSKRLLNVYEYENNYDSRVVNNGIRESLEVELKSVRKIKTLVIKGNN